MKELSLYGFDNILSHLVVVIRVEGHYVWPCHTGKKHVMCYPNKVIYALGLVFGL